MSFVHKNLNLGRFRQIADQVIACTFFQCAAKRSKRASKNFALEEDRTICGEGCEHLTMTPILRLPPKSALLHLMNNEGCAVPIRSFIPEVIKIAQEGMWNA